MAQEILSNVNNKYIISKEDEGDFGVKAAVVVALDFGVMQNISLTENENLEERSAINTGHTAYSIEEGLYNGEISLTTELTKGAMPVVFESFFGVRTNDLPASGEYTITTSPISSNILSYYLQATDGSKIWNVSGVVFTAMTVTIQKGDFISIELSGKFKKATPVTESISPSTTVSPM